MKKKKVKYPNNKVCIDDLINEQREEIGAKGMAFIKQMTKKSSQESFKRSV